MGTMLALSAKPHHLRAFFGGYSPTTAYMVPVDATLHVFKDALRLRAPGWGSRLLSDALLRTFVQFWTLTGGVCRDQASHISLHICHLRF
jgi:hypothetical protein